MDLNRFFKAKSIAIIGVSENPDKIGTVIFSNFIDSSYKGMVHPVNIKGHPVLGRETYKAVNDIKEKIDMAIISVPALFVPDVMKQCGKKGIKNIIIVSAGFKEIGNKKLEDELMRLATKLGINVIGPNCLGIFDAYSGIDTLFLPKARLTRPKQGNIAFVTQSGAVGSAILDKAGSEGYGFSKFVSYGNALNVDESDILENLNKDRSTKVICLYIEAVKDGRKFMKTASKVARNKPIIVIKGGLTEAGSKATLSHTGSLAGAGEIYLSAFRQAGIIMASTLGEMLNIAKLFSVLPKPKGNNVQIITNGGGYGVLSTDAVLSNGLKMAALSKKTISALRKKLSEITVVNNPMDLVGDATTASYDHAISACMSDKNIDFLIVNLLLQTPLISEDIAEVINKKYKKPIVIVTTGGNFTCKIANQLNIPVFGFPEDAVKAVKEFINYYAR